MIPVLKNYDYRQRLKACSLPTLHYRRIRGDMIETYKTVTSIYDAEVTPKLYPAHSLVTRGNDHVDYLRVAQNMIYENFTLLTGL